MKRIAERVHASLRAEVLALSAERDRLTDQRDRLRSLLVQVVLEAPARGPLWHGSPTILAAREALRPENSTL